MGIPIRIQRKRTAGWKMPANTIAVTRPGEFGNPFVVGGWYKIGDGQPGFSWLRCLDEKTAMTTGYIKMHSVQDCIEAYKKLMTNYPLSENRKSKLKGKNLACWCKEGEPCHADILLQIVNS
jgi:hypothetical protein